MIFVRSSSSSPPPRASYLAPFVLAVCAALGAASASAQAPTWQGYGGDPQHTALSAVPSASLSRIAWQTPVDLNPQYSGNDLLIHYGSPMITAANTVIVPVKTGATGGFRIDAHDGANGALLWSQSTDYQLPPHDWTPSYSPTLTPNNRLVFSGAGGTLSYFDNVNSSTPTAPTSLPFYSTSDPSYVAANKNNVYINTPLTSDANGNIFFGYQVNGAAPLPGLGTGGIGALYLNGNGTYTPSYVQASVAAGNDASIGKVVQNSAPALSADGSTVHVAVNASYVGFSSGYLLALNSSNLSTIAKVRPMDPSPAHPNTPSAMPDDGTASPTVGPDGHVYFGVYDAADTSRGWMQQFNLAKVGSTGTFTTLTPGGFGWDDTVSIVPASMAPLYHGTSSYLLMTKYNNYIEHADGQNMIALLDPTADMIDNARANATGATIMQVVQEIAGPTPDPRGGVVEWCINNAVVDPATKSILVNSEDGKLYRWDLASNTFTQQITLTAGVGEAYTPTLLGPNGAVYAINNATLFSIVPEPSTFLLAALGIGGLLLLLRRR